MLRPGAPPPTHMSVDASPPHPTHTYMSVNAASPPPSYVSVEARKFILTPSLCPSLGVWKATFWGCTPSLVSIFGREYRGWTWP